ncbi:MAG: hypothetical protein ACP5OG_02185 [Candidatus Nanoarchaeia archaeon]
MKQAKKKSMIQILVTNSGVARIKTSRKKVKATPIGSPIVEFLKLDDSLRFPLISDVLTKINNRKLVNAFCVGDISEIPRSHKGIIPGFSWNKGYAKCAIQLYKIKNKNS